MTETDYCEIDFSTIFKDGRQIWACNEHNKAFNDAEGTKPILCDECKEHMYVEMTDDYRLKCSNCD